MKEEFEIYTDGEMLIEAMPITYGDFALGRDVTATEEQLAQAGYVTCGRDDGGWRNGGRWIPAKEFEARWRPTHLKLGFPHN